MTRRSPEPGTFTNSEQVSADVVRQRRAYR